MNVTVTRGAEGIMTKKNKSRMGDGKKRGLSSHVYSETLRFQRRPSSLSLFFSGEQAAGVSGIGIHRRTLSGRSLLIRDLGDLKATLEFCTTP